VFRAPPSAFQAVRAAGVDVVSMADNHGMDYGETGLRHCADVTTRPAAS
jgi:poly-gamma-glutamate synthesis protein (capsule biosynthesis protein)